MASGADGTGTASVSLVTQTRVAAGQEAAFAAWQQRISAVVAEAPGFLSQTIIPPTPPAQVDWAIVQRFARAADARAWLQSEARACLVAEAQPMLVGQDDIHLVTDTAAGMAPAAPAPVAAVIVTRVKPGQESAFRQWAGRIAAVQARAPGFQGYRSEPPIPGIQEEWVTILGFDSEPHLTAWLNSPERRRLIEQAAAFTDASHVRTIRSGFDQWFRTGGSPPAAWKQNMVVLLALYPVVFFFDVSVLRPLLIDRLGMPFWERLFIANVVSVLILNWLVPWISHRFDWWLHPVAPANRRTTFAGVVMIGLLYTLCLVVFAQFP